MLISYPFMKCLRYNGVKAKGKIDNQGTSRHGTYPIDRVQAHIHGQVDPEKGQTFKQLVSNTYIHTYTLFPLELSE